ncbi:suppressor of fused domain protein [Ensifer sp. SSB1]|jgi:hypothetical protein|uniref:suppressor of fused domain protein n=1 Tax=Ensifer sp. SSB1 TaxID=2795385 RepID=UPI001A5FA213|nr:suppressor of fused domain protein [Ensifer sp. SSB1]MBK5571811.1 suppressor of fused domain protein [Ensifer sp. SSB1]
MKTIEHYEKLYGRPDRTARFALADGRSILIYKWSEESSKEGVTLYATDGVRELLKDGSDACEFYIGLRPEVDDVVEAIAEAAFDGNGTGVPPNSGDTITLSFPLWKGTVAATFLFTNGDGILPPIQDNGTAIHFVKLVPIFPNELEYKKRFGEDALWERFESQGVEYWNAYREPSS